MPALTDYRLETLDQEIAWWSRAAFKTESDAALIAFGVATGLKIAKADYGADTMPALTDAQHQRLQTILEALEPELKRVYPAGARFVEDQLERFARYGQDTRMSPKQWKWIEDIYKEFAAQPEAAEAEDHDPRDDEDVDDEIPF